MGLLDRLNKLNPLKQYSSIYTISNTLARIKQIRRYSGNVHDCRLQTAKLMKDLDREIKPLLSLKKKIAKWTDKKKKQKVVNKKDYKQRTEEYEKLVGVSKDAWIKRNQRLESCVWDLCLKLIRELNNLANIDFNVNCIMFSVAEDIEDARKIIIALGLKDTGQRDFLIHKLIFVKKTLSDALMEFERISKNQEKKWFDLKERNLAMSHVLERHMKADVLPLKSIDAKIESLLGELKKSHDPVKALSITNQLVEFLKTKELF